MRHRIQGEWHQFRRAPAGSRFGLYYERHQARDAPYLKSVLFFATIFVVGMAVLLTFVPGPALLFYLLALVLVPAESRTVATLLDRGEVFAREALDRLRGRRTESRVAGPVEESQPEVVVPEEVTRNTAPIPIRRPPRRPHIAGTMRIWSVDLPREPTSPQRPSSPPSPPSPPPEAAPKNTLVVFPPPPDSRRSSR